MQKQQIRLVLGQIKSLLIQLPIAKQQKVTIQLMKITHSQKSENEILNDLNYQYNFLKLTNPSIKIQDIKQEELDSKLSEMDEQIEQIQLDEKVNQDHSNNNENQIKSGTYIYKDGKLVQGQAEKKIEVDYSNWYAGNVDPEDLKKHKELLDRQYFSGPFWQGRDKPKSILDDPTPHIPIYSQERPKPEMNPNLKKPKEAIFEKVKR